jgi:hypothetical protein
MMSRIDSWHRYISTGRHFQNGHHNTAQIQHCPISTPFDMWLDWMVEIFQCQESIRDIIIYPHIKLWWYRTMLNFWGIVVAILKMATGRNFSMSGSTLGHHYLKIMGWVDVRHCFAMAILVLILLFLLSFFGTWTCPRQISVTTGQNFMKLGGVIDICF